ncbi:MAG: hypothetical protein KDC98_26085, partial [Planctomycetes bacterium]|nr:hypothetical protein [Planctomycetota bacterium]
AGRVIGKGASHLSRTDPIQYLVDQRAPMMRDDALEALGFRLAKTMRAGYDVLRFHLRENFDRGRLLAGQRIDLAAQAGIERYELTSGGFPSAYHAVSFAPVDALSHDGNATLHDLLPNSSIEPLTIGVLFSTERLVGVASHEPLLTVSYRGPAADAEPGTPGTFLLRGSDGEIVANIPPADVGPTEGGRMPCEMALSEIADDRAGVRLRIRVRVAPGGGDRHADFSFELGLESWPR